MRFYHIAWGHVDLCKMFVPRVPKSKAEHEDGIIPRICVADSIDHCFSAMEYKPYTTFDKKPVTIYSVNLDVANLLTPDFLYRKGLVDDALYTREHWILFPVEMVGEHCYLRNFFSGNYRVPDESKIIELREYVLSHAESITDTIKKDLYTADVDTIIRKVIPKNWSILHIDEEDAADAIGLENVRTMYDTEILR